MKNSQTNKEPEEIVYLEEILDANSEEDKHFFSKSLLAARLILFSQYSFRNDFGQKLLKNTWSSKARVYMTELDHEYEIYLEPAPNARKHLSLGRYDKGLLNMEKVPAADERERLHELAVKTLYTSKMKLFRPD